MPESPPTPRPPEDAAALPDAAIARAERWIAAAAAVRPDAASSRLRDLLREENGLAFGLGAVDGVLRPESAAAAAAALHRIAPLAPSGLTWPVRAGLQLGGSAAPFLPVPVVPLTRRWLRDLLSPLLLAATDAKLGPALAAIREGGERPILVPLGRRGLGTEGSLHLLAAAHEIIRRPDADRVFLPLSAARGRVAPGDFDDEVETAVTRLTPLFLTALANGTLLTLGMERYGDLDLLIAVFTRLLEDERLRMLEAGIALQTVFPDTFPALRELLAWAKNRVERGGARITIRLDASADLAAERTEATIHGWPTAFPEARIDRDAQLLRALDTALRPECTASARVELAADNLFVVAYARLLAEERGVHDDLEFVLRRGIAPAQARIVAHETGAALLAVTVLDPDEIDGAVPLLSGVLADLAEPGGFLAAVAEVRIDEAEGASRADLRAVAPEAERFLTALQRAADPQLRTTSLRTQDRLVAVHESLRPATGAAPASEEDLTQVVLGIARGAVDDPFTETAVYAQTESADDAGAPGFVTTADTDFIVPENRDWARGLRERAAAAGDALRRDIDVLVRSAQVRVAAETWGHRPAAERAEVLLRVAATLEARRGDLLVAAIADGQILADADREASAAVDFARYYAARARELDAISGATFVSDRLLVVAALSGSSIAVPAEGLLAALAAGSGVVLVAGLAARRSGVVLADILAEAGVPRDLVAVVEDAEGASDTPDPERPADAPAAPDIPLASPRETSDPLRALVAAETTDRVLFDGPTARAEQLRAANPAAVLLGERTGKNAVIVMPSADVDLAVKSLVADAFADAGQAREAASLVILVGATARSARFAAQLADAVRTLRVGPTTDARSDLGPLRSDPEGATQRVLTARDGEERWLVAPVSIDAEPHGRLWSPGIRVGLQVSSSFLDEDFAAPVLGVLHVPTLDRAIEVQNAVGSGLAAALHTQDPDDLAEWLGHAHAGNLFVNTAISGAAAPRQPFGGWASALGPVAKAGGPQRLIGLGAWRSTGMAAQSSTLHLRGLDTRIVALIEASQPSLHFEGFEWLRRSALSDAVAWDREYGRVSDIARLGIERHLLRYRPVSVAIRATEDAHWHEVLRVVVAAIRAGARFFLSVPVGLPAEVRRVLTELGAFVAVETDAEWIDRMIAGEETIDLVDPEAVPRVSRARLVGPPDRVAALRRDLLAASDLRLAVYDGEVVSAGRIELLTFVREQSISIAAHRFGRPDGWSAAVI